MSSDPQTFRMGFAWSNTDRARRISPAAFSTETAEPLPYPPSSLVHNPEIQSSIAALGSAISVSTPLNIPVFERLLATHPNRPFVDSVLWGLRHGFWPCDESEWEPEVDESVDNPMDADDLRAAREFRDKEISLGRWSSPVTVATLPQYTVVSPMFVTWRNDKPRVVTDHRTSGINEGIPREKAGVRYDNMHDFGQVMHDLKRTTPNTRYTLWKADVKSAFLNLPAHPVWQLHQIVTLDDKYHVVRRLVFGNRFSPRIWCAVSSLMAWIINVVYKIPDVHVYMDDFWGYENVSQIEFFHGRMRPRNQVTLLRFWDAIGCPYDDEKLFDACPLPVIGFNVDIMRGSISITEATVKRAVEGIDAFLSEKQAPTLRDWRRLAGDINWILNVFPWGRPVLSELHRGMGGSRRGNPRINRSNEVVDVLTWFKDLMPRAIGVSFASDGRWADRDADLTMHADADNVALTFVYSGLNTAFACSLRSLNLESLQPPPDLFLYKQLAIASAVDRASSLKKRRVLIYSDDLDTVRAFDTLHASDYLHNVPLLMVAEIASTTGIDIRVRHLTNANKAAAPMAISSGFRSPASAAFSPPALLSKWLGFRFLRAGCALAI